MENALPVVLGAVINRNNILLMKKNKSLFTDLWGLPSGKVNKGEHVNEAITRKMAEKAELTVQYEGMLSTISEILMESGSVVDHFLMFLCKLKTDNYGYHNNGDGQFRWFDLTDIDNFKQIIIPSDFELIKRVVIGGEQANFLSLIEKTNNNYELKKFEKF
ncbi:MAG TPA: NUDIX domain-containing protein [archaeon]|nr:NUDIX domain-containing protein [archaeon]